MCENNGYAITTSYKNSVSVDHVSDRASAYGMPGVLVDGQDAIAVWEATNEAVLRARAGEGPTLIEAMTYRYEDHSLGLDRIRKAEYRTQGEVEEAMKRDPLSIHRAAMTSHGFATAEECDQIEAKVKLEIKEAVEFARNSPFPEPDDLYDDMWATPV